MIPQELLQFAPKPRALQANEQWNVFLSYRSINRPWVLCLYDILNELGYKTFLDQYVLKPGDVLVTKLEDALQTSQAGVLIWSNAAKDSEWVKKEYVTFETIATNNKLFQFVPVKIETAPLPLFALNRIFIDFSAYPDGPNGGDLLRLLHAIAGIPLSGECVHFANDLDEQTEAAAAQVNAAIRNNRPQRLVQLVKEGGLPWKTTAALGCKTAEGLIKLKCYNEAVDVLEQLEKTFKKALRPKQLKALALARRGKDEDLEKAQDILGELYERNHLDPETMGIYARTWMDRYAKSGDINDLIQSRDLYAEAFEKAPDDYYTGINAASKSVLIGTDEDLKKAADYAARVEKITGTQEVPGDYWKTATIGEIFLIQKKYSEAGDMYENAVAMARSEKGSHESTYKQAIRLIEKLKPNEAEQAAILKAFEHLNTAVVN